MVQNCGKFLYGTAILPEEPTLTHDCSSVLPLLCFGVAAKPLINERSVMVILSAKPFVLLAAYPERTKNAAAEGKIVRGHVTGFRYEKASFGKGL